MQFLAPAKAMLPKFSVIDLQAINSTQSYKRRCQDVKGFGSTSSCSRWLCPVAAGTW